MTTFTPREIKNRKFKQSLMGVDPEEVKSFLKVVAAEFDKLLTQNAQLEKKLTEQTVKSTLGKKETEKLAEKSRQVLEDADRTASDVVARAREEVEEIRRKAEREAHEKARRETSVMLSQAKLMADEIILNANQKAEKIEAEARAAAAARTAVDFDRPRSIPGDTLSGAEQAESREWELKQAEEALSSFDHLIAEARAQAESIIENTQAEAEKITSSLIGRTLSELNKEHERLLAAVQSAVHKSEEIVKAARQEAEQFTQQRRCDAVDQCNAVLMEAERKAGALFSGLKSQAAARKMKSDGEGRTAPAGRRPSPKYQ